MNFSLRLTLAALALMLYLVVTTSPRPANPCGWWGDGEVDLIGKAVTYGNSVAEDDVSPLSANSSGGMGHGIAIFRSDHAVPYLRAIAGRKLSRIDQLKAAGFVFVIDIGAATIHKSEAERAGMIYLNIPVEGETPSAEQVKQFSALVDDPAHRPLVVFAPAPELLGTMWTLHRLGQGALHGTAIGEGRALQ